MCDRALYTAFTSVIGVQPLPAIDQLIQCQLPHPEFASHSQVHYFREMILLEVLRHNLQPRGVEKPEQGIPGILTQK